MNQYSDLEGLRIALDIEKKGYEFYRKAQESTNNQQHKLLFGYLMQEELNHASKFEAIYTKLKENKQAADEEYIFDPEVSRYMQVLVDTHIFPNCNPFSDDPALANGVLETGWRWQTPGKVDENITTRNILRMAIQAEKDSILFFEEMINNSRFPEVKKLFTAFKEEEQEHIRKLQDMINNF